MRNYDFYKTDCETVLSQIKLQEKQLKLKRRWLIGLDTVHSKDKQSKNTDFLTKDVSLPESMLREDDIFCETIKACINKAFRTGEDEKRHHFQVDVPSTDIARIRRTLSSRLNALTNKGLYLLAMILAKGSVNFEKTPRKMKQFIKASLPKVVETDVFKKLSQLLNDSQNFRDNSESFITPESPSLQDAAAKILDGLEDLPTGTLFAMKKKLTGVQGIEPQFPFKKCGWNRDNLVKRVREISEDMLSEHNAEDKLHEPLAKALAIAALSLKLTHGYQNSVEFHHLSPEMHTLQNEIAKALQLLKKIRFEKLQSLQSILEPRVKESKNGEVSNRRLRTAIKQLLTGYLFECVDMDAIPESLSETLAVINRNSQNKPPKCFTEGDTEQEVECILNVSAQTKQIVLDLLPDCEFDKDFDDAYMEDLVESDDDDNEDDDDDEDADGQQQRIINSPSCSMSHSIDSSFFGESIGDSKPNPYDMSTSSANRNGSSILTPLKRLSVCKTEKLEAEYFTSVDSVVPYSIVSSSILEESMGKSAMFQTNPNLGTPTGRVYEGSIKRCKLEYDADIDLASTPNFIFSNLSFSEEKLTVVDQRPSKNQYLAIQEVCDVTSITTYNLIGHMMTAFAQKKGLDLDWPDTLYLKGRYLIEEDYSENQTSSQRDVGSDIVQIVEMLTPPLSKSGIEKLKKLMGS